MKIIGLCGQSGSGKSSVSKTLIQNGFPVLNTDDLYHDLINDPLSSCTKALAQAFGSSILATNGAINRSVLREMVFGVGNEENLHLLNSISHACVKKETMVWILEHEKQKFEYVCLDVPLLFESEMNLMCDITVAVISSQKVQIERIMARDGVNAEDAQNRLASQISNDQLTLLCDYTITNIGTLEDLKKQVEMFLKKIQN